MKKGDKYIIEIAEVQKYHTDNGDEFELGRVKGFKALTLDESALKKLEPAADVDSLLMALAKAQKMLADTVELDPIEEQEILAARKGEE